MGFGTLKSLIRPLSRAFSAQSSIRLTPLPHSSPFLSNFLSPKHHQQQQNHHFPVFSHLISRSIHLESLSSLAPKPCDPLTNSRFLKRRPSLTSRRKRSSLRPPGPYAWVSHVPGEAVPPSQPNEGSVKLRNEKKRRRQRREFIKSERKKRKAELQEANRKKREKRIERKMESVARDREWAQRLVELERLEAQKKKTGA
ncbi:hypothetical protein BVRB_9g221620 [Beta vulgaris subsp. vulgaris]|uniref:uncharacterized protein LOC104904742 n=1 Tax=Beta vulgaris subsp. vulgaris TaxID=3555 RepID=UPI00053FFC6A|nr:uncharacterized protein LOC104904742 [Beta vulgaris subsp. vulgaris]KMT00890.1 hypothetical protein BVRB_9g221620 [Beta vulgaris subsp. vulgaris]